MVRGRGKVRARVRDGVKVLTCFLCRILTATGVLANSPRQTIPEAPDPIGSPTSTLDLVRVRVR